MAISPVVPGELNELGRGRQYVDQCLAAAAREVALGLDDESRAGDPGTHMGYALSRNAPGTIRT